MTKILLPTLLIILYTRTTAQQWQAMADIPVDLAFPVVVELNGNIHVIGGGASGGASDLHLRYTPATDSWDTLPSLPYLAQQAAGAVVDGKIHICGGGYPNTGTPLTAHYYYEPDLELWYPAADLPFAIAIHKAVALDGKLYCLSGQPDKTLCEYYDPQTNTWYANNPLPDLNFWYGAVEATSSTIYRFGGGGYIAPTNAAHVYDKVNDTWISLPDLPEENHAPAGVAMNDSLIIISGGYFDGFVKNSVWIYNINTQTYVLSDSLPDARSYHSMVLADGCVYSVGGFNMQIPSLGVSLLKNCSPTIPTSSELNISAEVPVTIINTPGNLTLNFTSSILHSSVTIILVDLFGRQVYYRAIDPMSSSITINGNEFASGMYLVQIVVKGESFTEKWMVVH